MIDFWITESKSMVVVWKKSFEVINLGFIVEKGYSKPFWASRWQFLGLCVWERHNVRAYCVENTEL